MLKTLRLQNFKSFEDTGEIVLKPITVLAGPNSAGKSSILQSLLLLNQTLDAPPEIDLSLDGKFLQFSSFSELVYGKPPPSRCKMNFSFGIETSIPRGGILTYFPGLEVPEEVEQAPLLSEIDLSFCYKNRDGKTTVALERFDVTSQLYGERGPRISGVLKGADYRVRMAGAKLPHHFKDRKVAGAEGRNFIPHSLVLDEQQGHLSHISLPIIFGSPLWDLEYELEDNLKYLGPLRERPQRAYLHSGNPMTEIGESGQYAAQILWLEKDNKIQYYAAWNQEPEERILIDAVNDTFIRLGLSQSVEVKSAKSIVYQILFPISSPKNKNVTIADVGFGVSQLLPIVVLGLRTDKSSLLLLEQPEIHLHPKLQANLADFLLAVTSQGKRLVVETHSDHFINRLRRRIAEDQTDRLKDQVNILFVHPPDKEGGATIEALRVDKFGVIENWPEDFLPEAADEAEAIFVAGMEKRENPA